jgi:hypothetical protein
MADIMQARRLLGIERATFNYETEPEEEPKRSSPPQRQILMRKRLFARNSLAARKQQQKSNARRLLKKKLAANQLMLLAERRSKTGRIEGPAAAVHQAGGLEEFNVDSIEALVDDQPVEDENTNDSIVKMESGHFSCAVCRQTFPSSSGLEYHQRTSDHSPRDHSPRKVFSCSKCGKR